MNEIDTVLAQVRDSGRDVWIAGPQSEDAITELQRALGVTLPPSYRQFLAQFGGLGVDDSFISGIIDGEPLGEGMGWLYADTQRFRQDFGLPDHFLVVQPDEEAPYCLDTKTRQPDGECPVICYELHSQHAEQIAPNFGTWLVQWLRQCVP